MSESQLAELRDQLGDIDSEFLRLVVARQGLAGEIGRIKNAMGRATRDFGQEREVIERARLRARGLGLSEDIAEALTIQLIRASVTAQEHDKLVHHADGSGRRVLVIGGNGKMGGWFVRFLDSQGFDVEIADPNGGPDGFPHRADWQSGDLSHDVIVLATPLQISAGILRTLAERKPPGLVFDIGSLKSPLREALDVAARSGVQVTSLHPMFGPNTEMLSGSHVIFVDVGIPEATAGAKDLFARTTAILIDLDLESHDRLIAYVLGLSHAVNIAFFTVLAESGEAAPRLATLSSTTFDAQLAIARQVAAESPDLYYEIQALNDYGDAPLEALSRVVETIRTTVRDRNKTRFASLMEAGRTYTQGRAGS